VRNGGTHGALEHLFSSDTGIGDDEPELLTG
jgi:hypothetical protein